MHPISRRLWPSLVIAFAALYSTASAAGLFVHRPNQLASGVVTGPKIAPDAVTSDKVAPNSLSRDDIGDRAITNRELNNPIFTAAVYDVGFQPDISQCVISATPGTIRGGGTLQPVSLDVKVRASRPNVVAVFVRDRAARWSPICGRRSTSSWSAEPPSRRPAPLSRAGGAGRERSCPDRRRPSPRRGRRRGGRGRRDRSPIPPPSASPSPRPTPSSPIVTTNEPGSWTRVMATTALSTPEVRDLIAERVTDELVISRRPDLVAARPLIQSVTSAVVSSRAFGALFRSGVRDLHRTLLNGSQDTVSLTLVDVGTLVADALKRLRPSLAEQVDSERPIALAARDVTTFGTGAAEAARAVRRLWLVLALGWPVLVAMALAASADRRRTVVALGVGAVAGGLALTVGLEVARAIALGQVPLGETPDSA